MQDITAVKNESSDQKFDFSKKYPMANDKDLRKFVLDEAVRHIKNASTVLNCSIMARAKALLIYHNFRRCVAKETRYDPYMVAAACISLSMKYNEEHVPLDTIVLLFFRMFDQKSQSTVSKEFKCVRSSLVKMECLILRMLEFNLNHAIAHQYLPYFMNDLQEELSVYNVWDVFSETCIRLTCDFYLSNKCLDFKADEIAVAVIQVSMYLLGVDSSTKDCYIQLKIKMLNNCSETKIFSIMEEIYSICHLGSYVESLKKGAV